MNTLWFFAKKPDQRRFGFQHLGKVCCQSVWTNFATYVVGRVTTHHASHVVHSTLDRQQYWWQGNLCGRTRSVEDGTQVGATSFELQQCARISGRHVSDGRPKKWKNLCGKTATTTAIVRIFKSTYWAISRPIRLQPSRWIKILTF
jgi:hypothetical protein